MPFSLRSRPFSLTLFVFIVALIVLVVVGITIVDYTIAERNLRDHQQLLEEQTEIDLNNSIMLVDEGLKLFDDTMNGEMEQGLTQFADEYERAGRDASAMNLTAIKRDVFHGTMDLYVINVSNIVEFTTYPPDQGLDFGTDPDFADYLNGIRNTSGFYPDRVVREMGSNILRKYAYFPTSDHRYILELGLIGDKFKSERQRLTYTETIKDIRSLNPYLEDARLFTQFKKQVGNSTFKPDAELKARLGRVIENKTGFDWIDPATGNKVRYKYINLKDEDYGSDLSMVAELTYSSRPLTQALSNLVGFHAPRSARCAPDRARDGRDRLGPPHQPDPRARRGCRRDRAGRSRPPDLAKHGPRVHGPPDIHRHHDRAAQRHDRSAPATRGEALRERGPVPPHPRPDLGLRLLRGAQQRRRVASGLVGRRPRTDLRLHVRPDRGHRRMGADRPPRRSHHSRAAHRGREGQPAA